MWHDTETDRDLVNFGIVAGVAADIITSSDGHPLTVGVSGSWGVGKSSMLKLIEQELKADDKGKKWIFVTVNPWLYQGYDDARTSLLDVIFNELDAAAKNEVGLGGKLAELAKRINYIRALKTGIDVYSMAHTGIPLASALTGFASLFGAAASPEGKQLADEGAKAAASATGLLEPKTVKSPPSEINAARAGFQDILNGLNARLVVFVDDLDRCLPPTVIGTLEAIRLFLYMRNTAFVIAADERMIKESAKLHFKGASLDDSVVTNYFDKLINVSLRVPPLGHNEVRAYMTLLAVEASGLEQAAKDQVRTAVMTQLANSWKGVTVTDAFVIGQLLSKPEELTKQIRMVARLANIMTLSQRIQGNPRLIKRFLNTLAVRKKLARLQGIDVPEEVLAKVLLFERCASDNAFRELLEMIHASHDGKSARLAAFERHRRDPKCQDPKPEPSPSWDADKTFVDEWLDLEPALGEFDLRGAIHVGRENLPVVTTGDRLRPEAAAVLEQLLALQVTASKDLVASLGRLSAEDRVAICTRVLERAAVEQKWGVPSVMHAIDCLAGHDAECATRAVTFFKDLATSQLAADIVIRLKSNTWAVPVLANWKARQELSPRVKNAIDLPVGGK